ncbi:hypothetical protein C8R41DRAFT_872267 [Lentinula lateritia]|uniref:Uncharacterized protein n=1 Tax=Lentinula lateritia TaxID=40482 RepID=A0ABQ8UY77_9AGAR|nr:hypothetical protein C8R41DRAFT_872267 [Lentinula lateritia]
MPCTMKAEIQHNIITAAHNFIKASILLEDLCDNDIPLDDLDNDYMEDAELLELAGVMTLQLAMEMDGDGTRGAYNQFPKSNDWFPASLQQPDRWFRSNYRMSRDMFDHLVYILAQNQIFLFPQKETTTHQIPTCHLPNLLWSTKLPSIRCCIKAWTWF